MNLRNVGTTLLMLLCSAPPLVAQSTRLKMTSEPGDFVGAGQRYTFTPADGPFSVTRNFANGVSVFFNTPTFSHFWSLDFAAPDNQFLTVGSYAGAVRYPFQPAETSGLSVFGDGRGCNTLTGSFQVLEVSYGPGDDIASFRATFEQHCEGATPALRGEIRINANVPIEVTAPAQVTTNVGQNINFTVTASDVGGGTLALSASGLPTGATFTDNHDNTGTFDWTPGSGQQGTYAVEFEAANSGGTRETVLTQILVRTPPPPNDDINAATVAAPLPFTASQDTSGATTAPDDPSCIGSAASVWFAFTPPADMTIEADTAGSNYDTTLSVYSGTRGALLHLACNDNADGTLQSRVRVRATAGTTYFFMVAAFPGSAAGVLTFHLHEGPPPLTIAPSLFKFASLTPSNGTAAVSGAVICSRTTFVSVFGELQQQHAGTVLRGFFATIFPCNGTTPWTANVQTQTQLALFNGRAAALLTGGPAVVNATAFAFDSDTGESIQINFTANVLLTGGR